MTSPNGSSCSNSAARPSSTRQPRRSDRRTSSASTWVLPIPGSPLRKTASARPLHAGGQCTVQTVELLVTTDEQFCAVPHPTLPRAAYARAVRSTALATSTRDDTSSLRKMLRMWVSTVFRLRNRSAAISGLVRRSTTRWATSSSRALSASRPSPWAGAGPVRRDTRWPSLRNSWSTWSR